MGNLLREPVFQTGDGDLKSEVPSVVEKSKKTFHHSTKKTPNDEPKKVNEKINVSNLLDKRKKTETRFVLGQPFRTAVIKRSFSKGVSTNWSYNFYTILETIQYMFLHIEVTFCPKDITENY